MFGRNKIRHLRSRIDKLVYRIKCYRNQETELRCKIAKLESDVGHYKNRYHELRKENNILRNPKPKIDLEELAIKIDAILDAETKSSLTEWLESKRS